MYANTTLRTLLSLFTMGLLGALTAAAQPVKVGKEFPNFKEDDFLTKKRISLEQFRGKVVLIDFWATWCGPCVKEIPNVKQVYEKYHKQGFEIISISLDQSKSDCERYIKRNKMDWNHICDGGGWQAKLAVRFGVRGIPQMYLLGKDGKVVSANARGELLEKALKEALAQPYDGPVGAAEEVSDDIEKQAQASLAKADKLEADGKHAAALKLYDEIGLKYIGRPTAKQANERARIIRDNPDIMKELEKIAEQPKELTGDDAQRAERWEQLAKSFAKQKNLKMARKYYQKIIETFPDSEQAAAAEKAINKLPK